MGEKDPETNGTNGHEDDVDDTDTMNTGEGDPHSIVEGNPNRFSLHSDLSMNGGKVSGTYSIPQEAQKIYMNEVLYNGLVPKLPQEIKDAGKLVKFTGSDAPSIPINWRFAESVSALKAFEASMLNVLRKRKYGSELSEVTIDTDHASLFVMSPFLAKVIENGEVKQMGENWLNPDAFAQYGFPNADIHRAGASLHRVLATNIYETKDGRFYHCHGSMNPDPTLEALGMDLDGDPNEEYESVTKRFQQVVSRFESAELDTLMNDQYRQAGTIAYSTEEFLASEHGKANAHVGLYEIKSSQTKQPASWWPENHSMPSSAERPLAGLKVVDLTRVIAAPTITRSLAEMGASVMRITAPHLTDLSGVHQDLNWGKWTAFLNLRNEDDRRRLIGLIREADVVVEGYRPGVMEKYGLSRNDIFELVKDRDRGIIHVKENCYGWNGPWRNRSGWQQISDACCGVSLEYGRAMGHNAAVTPVFPNSDYCTGIIGSSAVLHALIRRGEEGGSYGIDTALNYYSQWLVKSVGEYPKDIWQDVWERHEKPVFHNYHSMVYLLPKVLALLHKNASKNLFKDEFFERRESKAVGHEFLQVKPVAQFKDKVELRYNVGTRGNGYDQPYWPEDLGVEVVS